MAIFQFIKGNRVKNAIGYRLYKQTTGEDSNPVEVGYKDVQQTLEIVGAIGTGGVPAENPHDLYYGVSVSDGGSPIMKLGDNEYEYYYRVTGRMAVEIAPIDGATLPLPDRIVDIPFEGLVYMPDNQNRYFGVGEYGETIDWETKALVIDLVNEVIKLKFWVKNMVEGEQPFVTTVDIYNIKDLPADIQLNKVFLSGLNDGDEAASVRVYTADSNYRRSDYIPLDCLSDDLHGSCFGLLTEDDTSLPYYKISFYNEELKFITGVTYADIENDYGEGKSYLTVEEIKSFAASNAKYAIFCSRWAYPAVEQQGGGRDVVSVGGIYFPLLSPHVMMAENDEDGMGLRAGDILYVKAIGDGLFFSDSDLSYNEPPIVYNPVP